MTEPRYEPAEHPGRVLLLARLLTSAWLVWKKLLMSLPRLPLKETDNNKLGPADTSDVGAVPPERPTVSGHVRHPLKGMMRATRKTLRSLKDREIAETANRLHRMQLAAWPRMPIGGRPGLCTGVGWPLIGHTNGLRERRT